ncbi:MAG: hypothetical protein ACM3O5_07660 [Betaproteobacteria bacterium]
MKWFGRIAPAPIAVIGTLLPERSMERIVGPGFEGGLKNLEALVKG